MTIHELVQALQDENIDQITKYFQQSKNKTNKGSKQNGKHSTK